MPDVINPTAQYEATIEENTKYLVKYLRGDADAAQAVHSLRCIAEALKPIAAEEYRESQSDMMFDAFGDVAQLMQVIAIIKVTAKQD